MPRSDEDLENELLYGNPFCSACAPYLREILSLRAKVRSLEATLSALHEGQGSESFT